MNILIHFLLAVEAVVCLMLIGIILIQKSKGQGLGLSFGSGAAESVFGGQMGNVLTRTTVILAIVFLVNTTLLAVLKPRGVVSADVTERFAQEEAAAPAVAEATETIQVPAAASEEEMQAALADALADLPAADAAPAEAPAPETPAAEPAPAAAPEAPAPEVPAPEAPAPEAPAPEAPAPAEAPAPEAPAPEAPAAE